MARECIRIKGARQHNLKGIDLEIPRDKLVVFTGLSGSGKSSLAFDTIYAEGQRRYVESLSAYASIFGPDGQTRRRLHRRVVPGHLYRPEDDEPQPASPWARDRNLRLPAPSLRTDRPAPLSQVRQGHHARRCSRWSTGSWSCPSAPDQVLAPSSAPEGRIPQAVRRDPQRRFHCVRVDGELRDLGEPIELDKNKKHTIEIVVDRIVVREGVEGRLADSLETAISRADGIVIIDVIDGDEILFSERAACVDCGISFEEPSPRLFSFNSPFGACPVCDGLGERLEVDPDRVLNLDLSIDEGGLVPWAHSSSKWLRGVLSGVCRDYGIDPSAPLRTLTKKQLHVLLYGLGEQKVTFDYTNTQGRTRRFDAHFEGVIPFVERRFREASSDWARAEIQQYMTTKPCTACGGKRLKPESLAYTVGGKNIAEVTALSVKEALHFFAHLDLTEMEATIARQVLNEIRERLGFLDKVGLNYLTLDRAAGTLSGGEAQRIRLATQIGSSLVGVLYILDEPSIGLHQRDNRKLLDALKGLRDLGNTLIVVEHDEETMLEADYLVDIGPGAGVHGGRIVAAGTPEEVMACPESITGQYLSGRRRIPVPSARREPNGKSLVVKGAREHNLRNIDVESPRRFVCHRRVGFGQEHLGKRDPI